MKILNLFIQSFGGTSVYIEALSWRGKFLLYFLFLWIISSAGLYIGTREDISRLYDEALAPIAESVKSLKFDSNGNVILNEIVEVKSPNGILIGKMSPRYLDALEVKDLMFTVEKDTFVIYLPDGADYRINPIKDMADEKNGGMHFFPSKAEMLNFYWPFAVLGISLVLNSVYALSLSLGAFILSMTLLPGFGYLNSLKLAVFSMAPPIAINFILLVGMGFEMYGFIFAIISMGVIYWVMRAMATGRANFQM